jgi:hypothetical protein
MKEEDVKQSGRGHSLALAAALAMLRVSVDVKVVELLISRPVRCCSLTY